MTQPVAVIQSRVDDITAVVDLTQFVYDQIVEYFETCGVDLPKRREIVIGELVVEGQGDGVFGVMFGGTYIGAPGNEQSNPVKGDQPRTAVYNVELWRPVTTGGGGARSRTPKPSVITEQAKIAMRDCWILQRAASECDEMGVGVIATTAPLPPQGGLQGISLALSLQVP